MWKYEGKECLDCTNTMHISVPSWRKNTVIVESDDYILVGKISNSTENPLTLIK